MPSHQICPHDHRTQSMRCVPRMGSPDVQWVPRKITVRRQRIIHVRAGVGACPPHIAMSLG